MSMWKIIVKPIETPHAWEMLFRDGGFVAIGFPNADDDPSVKRFKCEIQVGDWVLAHLPKSVGGVAHLAVGLGKVAGEHEELAPAASSGWNGPLMRRREVKWIRKDPRPMPSSIRKSNYRRTVVKLTPEQERDVLCDCRITL